MVADSVDNSVVPSVDSLEHQATVPLSTVHLEESVTLEEQIAFQAALAAL